MLVHDNDGDDDHQQNYNLKYKHNHDHDCGHGQAFSSDEMETCRASFVFPEHSVKRIPIVHRVTGDQHSHCVVSCLHYSLS